MKLTLLLAFTAALSACTVRSTNDPTDATNAGAPAPTPGTEPPPSSAASVPADVIGQWTWVTSGGAQTFTFNADGTYADDVFLDGHPGESCGTELFTHRSGVATFTATTMTLRSTEARRTKTDSCESQVLADDSIEAQAETLSWHASKDETGMPLLVVERSGASATTYYPGGR